MISYAEDMIGWDVPNTRLVIYLKKKQIRFWNDDKNPGVQCAVALKPKTNYKSFNLNPLFLVEAEDEYQAIENLIKKANELSEVWWNVLQSIKEDSEVEEIIDWWNFPSNNTDFDQMCLQAIFKIHHFHMENNIRNIFLKSKEKGKYCVCLISEVNGVRTELFKSLPNGDKKIALNNLINSITNVGAYLDKIQNGAWDALIDKDNPNSYIKRNHLTGNLMLEHKQE